MQSLVHAAFSNKTCLLRFHSFLKCSLRKFYLKYNTDYISQSFEKHEGIATRITVYAWQVFLRSATNRDRGAALKVVGQTSDSKWWG